MIIDTHAHINDEKLIDYFDDIKQSLNTKLKLIICPSYSLDTMKSSFLLSQEISEVYSALAIHPNNADEWNEETCNFILENYSNKKVVALGEYGLDYHYEGFNKLLQEKVFLEQLELAKKCKLPSVFHVRDAFDDFISLLSQNLSQFSGGVVHCFDGDISVAKKLLNMGLMLSFTGLVTFNKKEYLHDVIKYVPIDRIMLETDAPYLAPKKYRGKICLPQYVEEVYNKVAEIKNIKREVLDETIENNIKKFFTKLVI